MKVFVTGCAGFIGSHLVEALLNNGYYVMGVDNFDSFYSRELKEDNIKLALSSSRFKFIEADLSNVSDYKSFDSDVDCVIHLAAKAGVRPSIESPNAYINSNIVSTENLLCWMNENNIKKMLFASSSSVYGNNAKIPFSENDNTDFPISPYAFTKKACELINYTYHNLYGIDIINLRFFTVYGPRQRPDLAIRKFIELIQAGKPIIMYGNGDTGRDYTYIDDTIQGILKSLNYLISNNVLYDIINLGNNKPVKLSELIDVIYNLVGASPNIIKQPMQPGDVELTYADISKANKILGYEPKTSLNLGIESLIKWLNADKL
jgi:UDP-glucuronate 4-epimerase